MTSAVTIAIDQPVPGGQQVGCRLRERALLIDKDLQGQTRVQLGIVASATAQLSVLIVLDEVVVRISWKCQGIETERIYPGKPKQVQIRIGGLEMRYVEPDQVVAEQEPRAPGELVEAAKRFADISAPVSHGLAATATGGSKAIYPPAFSPDLKIERKAEGREALLLRAD